MKGFKDTTKTQRGEFDFSRASTPVKGYTRAAPTKGATTVATGGDPMPPRGARPPPPPQPVALKTGGRLDAAERKALPKSDFGLPGKRAYPMPDKSHARNAKSRASQMVGAGKLSESAKAKIDAKANKVLKKAEGGLAMAADAKQDKEAIATAVHKHEHHDHPGKPLTKLRKGGVPTFSTKPMVKGC